MEQRIVDKRFINSLKVYSINNNSILFIKDEDLIKMPYINRNWTLSSEKVNVLDLEKMIELLSDIDFSNMEYYILPKYALYTSKVKASNYKGYGMNYLNEYKPIGNNIESNNYTHKEKLEICKKISDAITKLEKYKIAYWDVHSENILINKNNDIRLCDMDSATSLVISGDLEYKKDLLWSYKYLTSLLLAILYGIDEMTLIGYIKDNKDAKFIRESKMFQNVINEGHYLFYPDKYLDSFTEEYVEETKLILKKDNYE